MRNYFSTGIILCAMLVSSHAFGAEFVESQLVELKSYNNGIAIFSITVCNQQSTIATADIKFSDVQDEYALAQLKVFTSGDMGYCLGGRLTIQVDVKQLLKDKIAEKGIKSQSVLLKSLPNRIEFLN